MKVTIEQLEGFFNYLGKNPIIDGFSDIGDVYTKFYENKEEHNNAILHAVYDCPPYEGYATVLYKNLDDNKFYEVHGSHCSCYGLENQWSQSEILLAEFVNRLEKGSFVGKEYFVHEFREFLKDTK